jgi:hypothetical protein
MRWQQIEVSDVTFRQSGVEGLQDEPGSATEDPNGA